MQGCHVKAMPAGSRCNLNCRYCFWPAKQQHKMMDDATLKAFIRQQIDAQPGKVAQFTWQGGEPTLCGLAFFQRAAALQKRYANGKRIENTLQTNGILLNDSWCHFLQQEGWQVSVSVDGPADLHNAYRVSRRGKSSHQKAINAIGRLKKARVSFNLLCVVNNLNSQQPQRLYRYLRTLGTPFLHFIPLVEQDNQGQLAAESVSGEAWGEFLTTVFDLWARADIGRINIQLFDSTLGVWCGYPAQICSFAETCGHAFVLVANGDLYQCDRYVYPEYRLGNLHQIPIKTLNASREVSAFGMIKKSGLGDDCRRCELLPLCRGDCPQHRFMQGKSALCAGYARFFNYTAPHMRVMRDLLRQRRSPMELMAVLRQQR